MQVEKDYKFRVPHELREQQGLLAAPLAQVNKINSGQASGGAPVLVKAGQALPWKRVLLRP